MNEDMIQNDHIHYSFYFMFQHEWHTCPSQQDVTDAEPESLAEDDEKELSVVHPARPTTESLEPAEVGIGSDAEGG